MSNKTSREEKLIALARRKQVLATLQAVKCTNFEVVGAIRHDTVKWCFPVLKTKWNRKNGNG